MAQVRFNDALELAAKATQSPSLPVRPPVRIIRDVYGRVRFAVDTEREAYSQEATSVLEAAAASLEEFSVPGQPIVFRDDFSTPDLFFSSADWHEVTFTSSGDPAVKSGSEYLVWLLDRQITGKDWLKTAIASPKEGSAPRVVFYGLKGGVGRSTALAMLAYRLAGDGKRVLLMDFDLESPGLSGLLLPADRVCTFGLIDWFVEDMVGQGMSALADLVAESPLSANSTGSIRVAPAMGKAEVDYLSKLARVYGDAPDRRGVRDFSSRMRQVIQAIEEQEQPDVILIDSRAGLHDVAAVAISSIATLALLFATDSEQTWLGYAQLFSHWQRRPDVLRLVRTRLAIVQGLFPEADQVARADKFLQRSYELFSTHVYDSIAAGDNEPEDNFSFDLKSEEAPHFPMRIRWSARMQEFDPLELSTGSVTNADVELLYGQFFADVKSAIWGE